MLGQRIAALRVDAKMSQAELAHRLRISPSAVGMYEQGRREPSIAMLVALSQIFAVSTDYLLTGKPVTPGDGDTVVRILNRCVAMTDQRLDLRQERPFTRQELVVLLSAMLTQP